MAVQVMIADDHPVVRTGLASMLHACGTDLKVVGEAGSGMELLAMAGRMPADLFIVDVAMPEMDGFETCVRLIQALPAAKVIFLSMYVGGPFVEKAMTCGARGFVSKDCAGTELLQAIREVMAGRTFIGADPTHARPEVGVARNPLSGMERGLGHGLTRREVEVLQLLAEGYVLKEIAQRLNTSVYTVQNQRTSLLKKLSLHRQADLVRFALREGISKL